MARTPYWADNLINQVQGASGGSDTEDLFPALSRDERRGITVVRMLIDLAVTPETLSGVVASQISFMGIGVASFEAFGVDAVPDPDVETDRPARGWLWRTSLVVLDDPDTIVQPMRVQADVRSKRRVDDGVLFLRMINTDRTGITPFSIQVTGIVRVLYLLP